MKHNKLHSNRIFFNDNRPYPAGALRYNINAELHAAITVPFPE